MFGNLGKMMALAGQLRTRLPEMQKKLADARHVGLSGEGLIRATVNGHAELVGLSIDPSALEPRRDSGALADMVRQAVVGAQEAARAARRETMRELTGGMEVPELEGML